MFRWLPMFADWYTHRVDVDTLLSLDFSGAQTTEHHAAVPCFIEDTREWFTGDAMEQRPVSLIYAALSDRAKFTPGSEVQLPDGRKATVRSVSAGEGDPDLDGITVKVA